MLNEKAAHFISETTINDDFVSSQDYKTYTKIFKCFIHAIVIPLILCFSISFKVGIIYLVSMIFLYSTVFRKNAQYFFSILFISIAIYTLFVLS